MAASRSASGSSSKAASGTKEDDLEELLKHLEMWEDELDEVVVRKEEVKRFEAKARWLAIGRVNTDHPFSSDAMFKAVKFAWGLAQLPKYQETGENLFIFQMYCLGDWKKVGHNGPWIFHGFGMIIEDYDGRTDPASILLNGFYVWAQIHKVPDLYKHETIVGQLAHKIGKVKEVQLSPRLFFEGDYVRVRAECWFPSHSLV